MLKIKGIGLLLLFVAQGVGNSHYFEATDCFTDMDVRIPVRHTLFADGEQEGITEEEFNIVLDETEAVYAPIFEAMGKELVVNRLWSNGQVNASANQSGDKWNINMYGGMARHKTVTIDAFRGVVCHEIGHHLGGAPKKTRWRGEVSWASNEGQSDYYATFKCMKRLIIEGQKMGLEIAAPDVMAHYETAEIEIASEQCAERFSKDEEVPDEKGEDFGDDEKDEDENKDDSDKGDGDSDEDGSDKDDEGDKEVVRDSAYTACKRAALAGLSLGKLLKELRRSKDPISLGTPDEEEVSKTRDSHPGSQCRADTYFAGALCNLDFNSELSDTEPNKGTCNRAEGFEYGLRPLCWFKPPTAE